MWNDSSTIEGYQHVRELSDLHTFYMICLHGWRHNLDSLKYFIDNQHPHTRDFSREFRVFLVLKIKEFF